MAPFGHVLVIGNHVFVATVRLDSHPAPKNASFGGMNRRDVTSRLDAPARSWIRMWAVNNRPDRSAMLQIGTSTSNPRSLLTEIARECPLLLYVGDVVRVKVHHIEELVSRTHPFVSARLVPDSKSQLKQVPQDD